MQKKHEYFEVSVKTMNQIVQNLLLSLAVLLIFMFGYFYIKPTVPEDKFVSLSGLYQSDLTEWSWFIDCEDEHRYLLSSGIIEQLDVLYEKHSPSLDKLVYFEIDGRFVHTAKNAQELNVELVVDKVIKADPNKKCDNSN